MKITQHIAQIFIEENRIHHDSFVIVHAIADVEIENMYILKIEMLNNICNRLCKIMRQKAKPSNGIKFQQQKQHTKNQR